LRSRCNHISRFEFRCQSQTPLSCAHARASATLGPPPVWRNGRRTGLKILGPQGRAGSSPATGTIFLSAQCLACFLSCKLAIRDTSMKALEAPDLLYLEAAKGWFILGDVAEARNELNQIASKFQHHPDVLEVEFALAAKKRLWTCCMDIAAALLERA